MTSLAIYSERVVTPQGVERGTVCVDQGKITAFLPGPPTPLAYAGELIRADDLVVMPGLVDCHVHINQPGRTVWEGFATATRAAAAGGVTTLVDMPLNSIPVTTTPEALALKVEEAKAHLLVDCGFWGGLVPANAASMDRLATSGVLGVKAFLTHSGIDDFPQVERRHLDEAMPILAKRGLPLLVHAELETCTGASGTSNNPSSSYFTYLQSRPDAWELAAIALMIDLAHTHRCQVHIVHLSSAEALSSIRQAKAAGVPISAETCPHYLCLAAEEIPPGQTLFKCAPPIRSRHNATALWQALCQGDIDFVVSDHSPCTPDLKLMASGDFINAWGGIASLQLALPLLWTYGQSYGLGFSQLSEWLCRRPAIFAGLAGRKGCLAPGYDADLAIWDPQAQFEVTAANLHFRHKITPYAEKTLQGKVSRTYLRGQLVFADGSFSNDLPGQTLLRSARG